MERTDVIVKKGLFYGILKGMIYWILAGKWDVIFEENLDGESDWDIERICVGMSEVYFVIYGKIDGMFDKVIAKFLKIVSE